MASFARIEDGIVREVIAVNNDAIGGGTFPESEALGQAMLAESGFTGEWVQCSYSGSFRSEYPGHGWRYDAGQFVKPAEPDTITVPVAAIDALTLTDKERESLGLDAKS